VSRSQQPERRELWRQRIAQQQKGGQTVRAFCREHKLSEYSFYAWRRQLGSSIDKPIRFALVDTTSTSGTAQPSQAPIELFLNGGERLHIPADAATLQLVLSALRQQK
jgi:Transposase